MRKGPGLLDTGPLVSFLAWGLRHHAWAVEQWKRLRPPLLTCEPVRTEAAFLLKRALMRRDRNRPISLADACLVRLSEIHTGGEVFTLDSDFRIYRRHGNRVIPLLMPDRRVTFVSLRKFVSRPARSQPRTRGGRQTSRGLRVGPAPNVKTVAPAAARGAAPQHLLREIGGTLYHYARGQLIISALMAAMYAVGFALLDVPLWFLLAAICGLLNLIPWFGTLIAMAIGVAAALLGGLGFWPVMGVVWVFAGVSAIESFVLTPRIHGRRFQIRPLYIFLVVLAGGSLFGFLGMLLAVPALAVALVVERFYKKRSGEQQP